MAIVSNNLLHLGSEQWLRMCQSGGQKVVEMKSECSPFNGLEQFGWLAAIRLLMAILYVRLQSSTS